MLRPQDYPGLQIVTVDHICKKPFYAINRHSTIPNLGNLELSDIVNLKPTQVHYSKSMGIFGLSMSNGQKLIGA